MANVLSLIIGVAIAMFMLMPLAYFQKWSTGELDQMSKEEKAPLKRINLIVAVILICSFIYILTIGNK